MVLNIDREHNENNKGGNEVYVKVPKSIPIGVILILFMNMAGVIWAISSFYKETEMMKRTILDQLGSVQEEIVSLKNNIYTREEAKQLAYSIDKIENRLTYLERSQLEYKNDKKGR